MDQSGEHRKLDLLIRGFQLSRALRLAAEIGIADRVPPEGSIGLDALAASCNVLATPLLRILRALAAFDIFALRDSKISHTPTSLLLRTDHPESLHHAACFWSAPGSWNAWGAMDSALHGQTPQQVAWGTSRFEYLEQHGDEARAFDTFMAHFSDDRHRSIAESYDFSGSSLIADIGGGNGETLRRVLARHPRATGLVVDREDVVATIPADALLARRITAQPGNFFERLPGGASTYLLVRVLHNWGDEDAVKILRVCREAMSAQARLLIVDQISEADPSQGDAGDYLLDLQMMVMFGSARERTRAEFEGLLAAAGLALLRVIPTRSAVSILEVERA